jgi:hypothetical protein
MDRMNIDRMNIIRSGLPLTDAEVRLGYGKVEREKPPRRKK